MQTRPFRNASLAAAFAVTFLGIGCAGSKLAQQTPSASATPASSSTSNSVQSQLNSVATPVVQYDFFNPSSEQDLREHSNYGYLIVKIRKDAKTPAFASEGLTVAGRIELGNSCYYYLHADDHVLEAMQSLKATPGVIFAEPDFKVQKTAGIAYSTPDPRAVSEQYSMLLTGLKEAWTTYGFGPNRPVVADLDTGINFTHEDLKDVVKHAYSWYDLENGGAQILPTTTYDIDPKDYIGSATITSTDQDGHGSHTAGTIAASGNNGKGVAGVCWNADLVSYKVFADTGSATSWSIYGSLYHLAKWKAKNYPHTIAVNMSLGGSAPSQFAIDMVENAVENNLVIVASMGNSGSNLIQYPSGYAGVIAVGASTGRDTKATYSTTGRNISVMAPGDNVISTYNGASNAYFIDSGTSMAAPFVTGLVTYMLTFAPDLNAAQIKTYLETNTDLIEGATGFTERDGWGRVNVLKTIAAVSKDAAAKTPPAENYLFSPLKAITQNTYGGNTVLLPNLPVCLYSCDSKGVIANYVASTLSNSSAEAPFNLLKPGNYFLSTAMGGLSASSPVFQVTAGQKIPQQAITFTLPTTSICTVPDAGTAFDASGTPVPDTVISIYRADGTTVVSGYDLDYLDTLTYPLPSGTYKIKITAATTSNLGEYALYVASSPYPNAKAPGSVASPVNAGSLGHTSTTSQTIALGQVYNGKLTTSPDYYTITIP